MLDYSIVRHVASISLKYVVICNKALLSFHLVKHSSKQPTKENMRALLKLGLITGYVCGVWLPEEQNMDDCSAVTPVQWELTTNFDITGLCSIKLKKRKANLNYLLMKPVSLV